MSFSFNDKVVKTGCEDSNMKAVHLILHRVLGLGVMVNHKGELSREKTHASICNDNR